MYLTSSILTKYIFNNKIPWRVFLRFLLSFSEEQTLHYCVLEFLTALFPKYPEKVHKFSSLLIHSLKVSLCFRHQIVKLALSLSFFHLERVFLSKISKKEWATSVSLGLQSNRLTKSSAKEEAAHTKYGRWRTSHGIVPRLMLVVSKCNWMSSNL